MKAIIKVSVIFTTFLFMSCANNSNEKSNDNAVDQTKTAMYQCPMKCEGEKMYEEKGICPVCEMNLKLVSNDQQQHKH